LSVLAHDEAGGEVFFEGLRGFDVAEVIEDFVPEAGVEKVEDRVFFSADVEIDKAVVISPIAFGFGADEIFGVIRIAVAEVIPAGARPLGHGVGFALEGVAVVDPVGAVDEGATGVAGGLEVLHLRLE
jgi:hypothetical protein